MGRCLSVVLFLQDFTHNIQGLKDCISRWKGGMASLHSRADAMHDLAQALQLADCIANAQETVPAPFSSTFKALDSATPSSILTSLILSSISGPHWRDSSQAAGVRQQGVTSPGPKSASAAPDASRSTEASTSSQSSSSDASASAGVKSLSLQHVAEHAKQAGMMVLAGDGFYQAMRWDFTDVMDAMVNRPDLTPLLVPAAVKEYVESKNTPELFERLARLGVDVRALLRQEIVKDVERKFMTVMCLLRCACMVSNRRMPNAHGKWCSSSSIQHSPGT